MAFGTGDDLRDARKYLKDAVDLLLGIVVGEKTVEDARAYLEKEYPKLCHKDEKIKKW